MFNYYTSTLDWDFGKSLSQLDNPDTVCFLHWLHHNAVGRSESEEKGPRIAK